MQEKSDEKTEPQEESKKELLKGISLLMEGEKSTAVSGKEAADKQVLSFINDFREDDKSIRQKFCAGYCYYFAVMLKDAFHRGEICWCAPLGHICWVDDNGVPYDIDGVCDSDCNFFIPIRYIREGIEDFRHVPGREFNASREYIQNAIQTFCKDVIANIENKGEKL